MPNIDKLLKQNDADFKRYTGTNIHKAIFHEMLNALQQHETRTTKSGRPSALSLEIQKLLALTYWREYRTLYHISMDFGIHKFSASRIIRKVEDVLTDSGKFKLPKKLPSLVDATETPIERSKNQNDYYSGKKKPQTLNLRLSSTEKQA